MSVFHNRLIISVCFLQKHTSVNGLKIQLMENKDILKGLCAGLLAGAAATLAKTIWEEYFPVRDEDTKTPPAKIAQRVADSVADTDLTEEQEATAEKAVHWTFGTGAGLLYGLTAEENPVVTAGFGTGFGTVFWLLTHATVIPAADLEPYPTEIDPPRYALNELAGHLVYGVTAELVRRGVRAVL